MYFSPVTLHDLDKATRLEWLITNGLGGFASSTVPGVNTRRYHGLLVAALDPPGDRMLLVSKLEVEMVTGEGVFPLSTNQYHRAIHPEGYRHLYSFTDEPWPTYLWRAGGAWLREEILMPHGENATLVVLHLLESSSPVTLRVTPLLNCRDYHSITREAGWPIRQRSWEHGTVVEAYDGAPRVSLIAAAGSYHSRVVWYREMEYEREKERGLSSLEDHYSPGYFEVELRAGEEEIFRVALGGEGLPPAAAQSKEAELRHRQELLRKAEPFLEAVAAERPAMLEPVQRLVLSADAFVAKRHRTEQSSILAGFPWFTDWGRDAMIALPGLTLVTGRAEIAREVLATFAAHCRQGLIPNRFTDASDDAEYNTIDGSLWFVQAVYRYLLYTRDLDFVRRELWPVVKEIIACYRDGTLWGIKTNQRGLVTGGSRDIQLTWMDARVGDVVVTPRHGMAVEINALWYNALRVAAVMSGVMGNQEDGAWDALAIRVRESFREVFWNQENRCLYDVVTEEGAKDDAIRPNQIFAASLPFGILPREEEQDVIRVVSRELLTPYGLRSLSPGDRSYQGVYAGDQWTRDAAYHQGTVWSWLMGPFITAISRVYGRGEEGRELIWSILTPLLGHVHSYGLGYISEIFDGDYPHPAKGCIAQAWSVGEVLRAISEDLLGRSPESGWLTHTSP